MSIKRAVQSAFLDAGLTLEKEALNAFVAFVEERGADQQLIFSLLDAAVAGASWRSPRPCLLWILTACYHAGILCPLAVDPQ